MNKQLLTLSLSLVLLLVTSSQLPASPGLSSSSRASQQPSAACAWRQVDTRSTDNPHPIGLADVAGSNSEDVWTVGGDSNGDALIEHWDGKHLTVATTSVFTSMTLLGVAPVSSNNVWAVGLTSRYKAVTAHWDGSSWQRVANPVDPQTSSTLRKVAAIAADNVWAVGYSVSSTVYPTMTVSEQVTLIEHWDGSSWQIVPSPNVYPPGYSNYGNELFGLAVVAADNIWAVGRYTDNTHYRNLILHWDGTSWQLVPAPRAGGVDSYNTLFDISARAADDIWAVGLYQDRGIRDHNLILHWDGTVWQVVASPTNNGHNDLVGVSAFASDNVWAVGNNTDGTYSAFAMHWDGSSWQIVGLPRPVGARFYSPLNAVEAFTADDAWAVGEYEVVGQEPQYFPLIYHYSCTEPTVTPTPTLAPTRTSTATTTTLPSPPSSTATATATNPLPAATASATASVTVTPTSPTSSATATSQPLTLSPTSSPPLPFTATSTASASSTPLPATATPCLLSFSDLAPGYLFYQDIRYLACTGTVNGYPNGDGTYRFAPNQSSSRGEFAKIVVRGFGLAHATPAVPSFSDVPASNVFYSYIEGAVQAGVVSGYGDGTYRPAQYINRGEVAKLVRRAANLVVYTPTRPTFADVPSDYFAYVDVETLYQARIISGLTCASNLCFRPNAAISRGELSKLVHRALELLTPAMLVPTEGGRDVP